MTPTIDDCREQRFGARRRRSGRIAPSCGGSPRERARSEERAERRTAAGGAQRSPDTDAYGAQRSPHTKAYGLACSRGYGFPNGEVLFVKGEDFFPAVDGLF